MLLLLRKGKSNKEIAELLNIAIKTVLFHRNSLKKTWFKEPKSQPSSPPINLHIISKYYLN